MSEQTGVPSADQPADHPATHPDGPSGPVYGDAPRFGYQQSGQPGQSASASEHQPPFQPPGPAAADSPDDQPPYGQAPYGHSSSGQSFEQSSYGQAPHGQAPYGQVPYGQVPYEQAPYEQAPYGQAPYQGPYDQPTAPQQPYPPQASNYPPGYPQSYSPNYPQSYPAAGPMGYGVPTAPVYPYAPWIRRVGAYLIDFAPTLIAQIPFFVGYVLWLTELSAGAASGIETMPTAGLNWMLVGGLLVLAAFGWQIYNRWIVAGRTGQSLGKRVLKLRLLAEATGQPIGVLNAFLRDMLHILDGFAYVGYLWPLWDEKRQTFSDKLMNTVVVTTEPPPAVHG